MSLSVTVTQTELDEFIIENRRWLSEEAEDILRAMEGFDQSHVIAEGSMSNCRDPVAIVKSRAWYGCLKAHITWMEERKDHTPEHLLEDFIKENEKWMNVDAEDRLRGLLETPDVLWRVVDFGTLHGCRDPASIIEIRARPEDHTKGSAKNKGKSLSFIKGGKKGGKPGDKRQGGNGEKGGGKGGKSDRDRGSSDRDRGGKGDSKSGKKGQLQQYQQQHGRDDWGADSRSGKGKGVWSDTAEEEAAAQDDSNKYADRDKEFREKSEQAVEDGRAMYCVGLPPMWSTKQIESFFS
eukprot:CAMPEP_0115158314 /NCGR_PEP_ID=MMETSP0227-20121206/69518_1 /TAXON_ID=89957 /ORGANISM="Polarella glacialis, Strain CCMP 1383" /LENGTH=293 /DNA_ID=CAMNT_0002569761 /DNA_START=74 /DNA_END=951 /DNA_ORIENTATION=-